MSDAIRIPDSGVVLHGSLSIPENAGGIVLFAHGSGSGRHSPRNRYVASVLHRAGFGTLLFDLLTEEEEAVDEQTRRLRFDIPLLAGRLEGATDWLVQKKGDASVGYFGASTGAAAALVAAARRRDIAAVVSRGGRPDLADQFLGQVKVPTLLIVGGDDEPVIGMNQQAYDKMELLKKEEKKKMAIVPGATHLFEEEGKLEHAAKLASQWFSRFLVRKRGIQEAT